MNEGTRGSPRRSSITAGEHGHVAALAASPPEKQAAKKRIVLPERKWPLSKAAKEPSRSNGSR